MSVADILGMEDNPFGLFLILILLLGATGYFDPPDTKTSEETRSEEAAKPSIMLPVWQTRPAKTNLVRPFSGPRPSKTRDAVGAKEKRLIPAIVEMLGSRTPQRSVRGWRRALLYGRPRHPLLLPRHNIQQ